MPDSIFNRLRLECERKPHVVVTTIRNKIEGKLIHVDDEGNLTILSEKGTHFVQRKYIINVCVKKFKSIRERNGKINKIGF